MKYNTVIFDLDGTLLNSLDDIRDSTNFALRKCGFPERSLEEINAFVGNGTNYLIRKAVPDNTPQDKLEECTEIYRNHYITNKDNKTKPYDGILEMLDQLKDENYKIAIVSNKFDSAVKELNKVHFSKYVSVAIGESTNIKRKPAPDSILAAIDLLDSTTVESIYVGDTDVDVEAAHNAGIPCIGVTWGFRSQEVLENAGADYITHSPDGILKILNS